VIFEVKLTPPFAESEPLVTAILETRELVVLPPPSVITPETSALPALIYHPCVTLLADGCSRVTVPLTESEIVPE
jgi:hypothetical protein